MVDTVDLSCRLLLWKSLKTNKLQSSDSLQLMYGYKLGSTTWIPSDEIGKIETIAVGRPGHEAMMVKTVLVTRISALGSILPVVRVEM